MDECIFCYEKGPYNTIEHIIPKSLGNDDFLLHNCVCDKCQNYFGRAVQSFVLLKTPFAFWRVKYGTKSKKGKLPSIDFSVPKKDKGKLPIVSKHNDQFVNFTAHDNGSMSVSMQDKKMLEDVQNGDKTSFKFLLSPKHLVLMGRFLGKMAIEILADDNRSFALHKDFNKLRKYTRQGITKSIWPIINGQLVDHLDIWKKHPTKDEESCTLYHYSIVKVDSLHIFIFDIGWERWGIVLNSQFPDPSIINQLNNTECESHKFIWYRDDEWRK
ncbi:MAG: hypothetical protein COB67_13975 [SAR324 cluster bacterium]|uniref:HNH endonuclease 5 domain-containing protein n=1 Tax=SAR324 cluster bacterium TaxID=2024889 RepID=A0A2A4SKI3_9DELT|nr:MAG: hypothetical protein COB67_13975 [SAR324 cluster bacterium]